METGEQDPRYSKIVSVPSRRNSLSGLLHTYLKSGTLPPPPPPPPHIYLVSTSCDMCFHANPIFRHSSASIYYIILNTNQTTKRRGRETFRCSKVSLNVSWRSLLLIRRNYQWSQFLPLKLSIIQCISR